MSETKDHRSPQCIIPKQHKRWKVKSNNFSAQPTRDHSYKVTSQLSNWNNSISIKKYNLNMSDNFQVLINMTCEEVNKSQFTDDYTNWCGITNWNPHFYYHLSIYMFSTLRIFYIGSGTGTRNACFWGLLKKKSALRGCDEHVGSNLNWN